MESIILTVVLVALGIAAIWLVVEVALTVRRARPAIDAARRTIESVQSDVTKVVAEARPVLKSVDETLTQARPVITHVDELVTQAKPAASDVSPLLTNATQAVEDLSANLTHLDAILSDVSRITGTASNATQAVGAATTSIVDRVRGRLGLGRSGQAGQQPQQDASLPAAPESERGASRDDDAHAALEAVEAERADVVSADEGYFTYPSASADARARGDA